MTALQVVKSHLEPGMVYRRADLDKWSNAIDRHLKQLQQETSLLKVATGMYYCPKESAFGKTPPHDQILIEAFLKDTRFLITTPNAYNALGVGTTQLYNETVVYNHKRHGRFKLGNRYFQFIVKHHFPLELNDVFLLVDLVDNLARLVEDRESILKRVATKVNSMDSQLLREAVQHYGSGRTKKFFVDLFKEESLYYGS
ncbi:DUF6088 family protein [Candidatus Odyssella acanthamoebae]|uniref:AbiEi antitoxin C-terminal domain-containing protein n=1 Tax=Candidatus Odyssella acanthamoebae TaxID=91604 RepID=A0A077AV60_9PROT|nr:DUF6088 family protein [Candidatus Paracaedibacter acanthamoebae]AIK96296.1 hypothetical protein ID47_05430 [Candidatus Paracaedibacter acanthamoebae]